MHAFESASTLISGDDGAFEFAVGVVELGLVGQDAFVEGPVLRHYRVI